MATEIFCCRMQNKICSEIERILKVWGSKSIIYAYQYVSLMSERYNCFDIDDVHHGIGRSFQPQHFGFWGDEGLYITYLLHVGEFEFHTEALEYFGKHPVGSAI